MLVSTGAVFVTGRDLKFALPGTLSNVQSNYKYTTKLNDYHDVNDYVLRLFVKRAQKI